MAERIPEGLINFGLFMQRTDKKQLEIVLSDQINPFPTPTPVPTVTPVTPTTPTTT